MKFRLIACLAMFLPLCLKAEVINFDPSKSFDELVAEGWTTNPYEGQDPFLTANTIRQTETSIAVDTSSGSPVSAYLYRSFDQVPVSVSMKGVMKVSLVEKCGDSSYRFKSAAGMLLSSSIKSAGVGSPYASEYRLVFCRVSSTDIEIIDHATWTTLFTIEENEFFEIEIEGNFYDSSGTITVNGTSKSIQTNNRVWIYSPQNPNRFTSQVSTGVLTISEFCVGTDGDDCSLEPPTKEIPVKVVVNPHDQRCTKGKNRPVGIEVSIRGSEELDVATIDYSTISAGGLELDGEGLSDGACILEYVDDDEFVDATCRFRTGDIPMSFSGSTLDGDTLVGEGSVCLK